MSRPHPAPGVDPSEEERVHPESVEVALAEAHRREWALVLAATVRVVRDLDLAEDCVQEAYAQALVEWTAHGVPANSAAWLTTAAKRRGIDAIRRDHTLRTKLPLLVEPVDAVEDRAMDHLLTEPSEAPEDVVPDDRLRLVFLCCHPALSHDAQAALTLRLVCGVSTPDIARLFLVPEPTMAARITRAKKKIVGSRIPYRMPDRAELPARLDGVSTVVYLLFTTGHTAPSGGDLVRPEIVEAAVHLARTVHELMPDVAEVRGLLGLILAVDARRATRVDDRGRLVQLEDQDRSRWDRAAIAEAEELVTGALGDPGAGRFVLQAAIAVLYARATTYEDTDWAQVVLLYDQLLRVWPSPVVALNRTVPLAELDGPDVALAEVERLQRDGGLDTYAYLPAVRARLLVRLGRPAEAAEDYRRALQLTDNEAERAFLTAQLSSLAAPT